MAGDKPINPCRRRVVNVGVFGTMSAGKSTLLNALIGQELLPVANQASTACITRIEHRPHGSGSFVGLRYGENNRLLASRVCLQAKTIRDWNAAEDTHTIALRGPFAMAKTPMAGLTLYDTPGPNNSQNKNHRLRMQQALQYIPFDMLFCVMNAQHPEVNDERDTLLLLQEALAKNPSCKILFVLNKADSLDSAKENLAVSVQKAARNLESIGFVRPMIIPAISHAAVSAKKVLAGAVLGEDEEIDLAYVGKRISAGRVDLINAACVPDVILEQWHKHLQQNKADTYRHLLAACGLTVMEYCLEQCLLF